MHGFKKPFICGSALQMPNSLVHMKTLSILIACLLVVSSPRQHETNGSNSIDVRLKLKSIETTKNRNLLAIEITVFNKSDKRFYVEGLSPLISSLIIFKIENKMSIDVTKNWLNDELYYVEQNSLYDELGSSIRRSKIVDPMTNNFMDSNASAFYESIISKIGQSINQNAKLEVRKWVQANFERALFLEPFESVAYLQSLNTLDNGLYKIYFEHEAKAYPLATDIGIDLNMPDHIDSYCKWEGHLNSDTLSLWIK